jgi:hypothetical protein
VKKLTIILGALALFLVQPVAGQDFPVLPTGNHKIQYTGNDGVRGRYTVGTFFVGKYSGDYLGPPTPGNTSAFTMYCVDFHGRLTQGQTWDVQGSWVGHESEKYHKAAFLASLFNSSDYTIGDWSAIHAAIWYFTDNVELTDKNWTKPPDFSGSVWDWHVAPYVTAANEGFGDFDLSTWYLLESQSELNTRPQWVLVQSSPYSVPEPGVIVLLLSGLLGVAFVARRRASQIS